VKSPTTQIELLPFNGTALGWVAYFLTICLSLGAAAYFGLKVFRAGRAVVSQGPRNLLAGIPFRRATTWIAAALVLGEIILYSIASAVFVWMFIDLVVLEPVHSLSLSSDALHLQSRWHTSNVPWNTVANVRIEVVKSALLNEHLPESRWRNTIVLSTVSGGEHCIDPKERGHNDDVARAFEAIRERTNQRNP
jgi:hypothetical protein